MTYETDEIKESEKEKKKQRLAMENFMNMGANSPLFLF